MDQKLGKPGRDFHAGEFALVIFIAFSWSILASLVAITHWSADAEIVAFTDAHLWGVVICQAFLAPVIAAVLHHSGWRWRDFHVGYSNRGTIEGLLLAIAMLVSMGIAIGLAGEVRITPPSASLAAVLVLSLVNPWYEELLVCAFVIESLRKRFGVVTAVNVSIAIRLTYHLYQGPPAFIAFAIFGLVTTLFYVRTGRLWPVIVAHSLEDFVALAGFGA